MHLLYFIVCIQRENQKKTSRTFYRWAMEKANKCSFLIEWSFRMLAIWTSIMLMLCYYVYVYYVPTIIFNVDNIFYLTW